MTARRMLATVLGLTLLGVTVGQLPAGAAIASPVQISPMSGDVLAFPADPPLFRWRAVVGADSYRIEIDDAPDFVGAVGVITVNTAYSLTEPQTIGQAFYWRVQAITESGAASDWSPTWSYEIDWPASAPGLLQPADGATVEDVVFSWAPVLGAASYEIQVSPNGDWANNLTFGRVVKGTTYAPPEGLQNASYFWRVRARDSATTPNLGSWSTEQLFTRAWIDAPSLLDPPDTVALSVTTPTFAWEPIPHASHYEIAVGTDELFSPGTFEECFTNHTVWTYHTASGGGPSAPGGCDTDLRLTPGTVYWWRVRGVDAPVGAASLWSTPRRLLYRAATDDVPALLTPASDATVATPTLTWAAVPDIQSYKVTIVKPGGSTTTETTLATSWTPTSSIGIPGATFTWYVQTLDWHGKLGVIGEQRTFTLEAPQTSAEVSLLGPTDGATSVRMPSMRWTPMTDATYYEVWYSLQGVPVESALSGTADLKYGAYTHDQLLSPGTYTWRVKAFGPGAVLLDTSSSREFTIQPIGDVTPLGPCSQPQTPCTVNDTPTLAWEPEPHAGLYLVYLSQDAAFSSIAKTYTTQFTTLTPRESLLDNQAGKAYYWFVRACVSPTRCGRFDGSVHPSAFSFRKVSKAVQPSSPANGATVANQVVFSWADYLGTNLADPDQPTQEAKQYRIQVSAVADFAKLVDEKTVDQTTFSPYDRTYPEGTLYWRVQAIDGSGNLLTQSVVRSVVKSSPKISLQQPKADVRLVSGLPYFRWTPQAYAAQYELEVYRNGDLNFSPTNRVLTQRTKMTAWAPTKALELDVYAWRIRRLDADGKPGPWSNGRRFTLAKSPTTTTVSVTKTADKVEASGKVVPAAPGEVVTVTLLRKEGDRFVRIARKTPTIRSSGAFTTAFARPAPGSCKVTAKYGGDERLKPSSDTVSFRC